MKRVIRLAVLGALLAGGALLAQTQTLQPAAKARNVILFLADAGGLPTLNAASIYGHGAPQKLYINSMPHIGLSDTSTASQWVTDSAAGMTAIVTGQRTHNGVIAQSAAAVRGKHDGEPLKTILEYAEERGLSTGVITNSAVLSATPAATYAHVNDRGNTPDIFTQLVHPRFGDGVDVVIGDGRTEVEQSAEAKGLVAKSALRAAGLPLFPSLDAIAADARRAVVLFDGEFDLDAATQRALDVLSRNPNGYFLMVESDTHTSRVLRGLKQALEIDQAIRHAAERVGDDTLILFTADHSYDFRVRSGRRKDPLVPASTPANLGQGTDSVITDTFRRDDSHTGEEVLVAAQGPGAELVHGFFPNTALFDVMMQAFGWK
jgi:alkaline phosphatase